MSDHFLLLDPALLIPPQDAEVEAYNEFWVRVVDWASDRRVLLGADGRSVLLERLGTGWPDTAPPFCPKALVREAAYALNTLLGRVAPRTCATTIGKVEAFDPSYVRDAEIQLALQSDVELTHNRLLGTATAHEHWASAADITKAIPGPPDAVPLLAAPHAEAPGEVDIRVGRALRTRALTIVGGKKKPAVITSLTKRFGCSPDWIEAEKGSQPNLAALKGMKPEAHIIVCLTGKIGHAGSEKTAKLAAARAVPLLLAATANDIEKVLRDHFGDR